MISITTTGYGDVVPVADHTRMFDALVVTPIRIFFVLIFIGTAYTFVFRRTWDKWQMARLQRTLSNHIVVAGFGTSGSEAVDELIARGASAAEHRRRRLRGGSAGAGRSARLRDPAGRRHPRQDAGRPSMSTAPRR